MSGLKERLAVLSGAFNVLGISPIEAKEGKVKPKKEQKDYRADLIELEKKLALDLAKARIDGMSEGFDKEMAQMDYEHQRRLAAIDKQKQDLLEAQGKAGGSSKYLTLENLGAIATAGVFENQRYKKQTQEFYKSQLDKYKTYQEQKVDLDSWYIKEQESLREAGVNLTQEQLEAKLGILAKTYQDKMKEINDAELNELMKHSTLLVRIFGDAANMSRKRLKENIASAKQLLAYISRQKDAKLPEGIKPEDAEKMIGDYEAIRKLQKTILDMEEQSQKIGDYPLSGFVKGFMNLEKQAELAKKAIEATSEEEKELAKNLIDAEKTKAIKNFGSGIEELGGLISKAAEEMQKFADIAGSEKLSEAADSVGAAGEVIGAFGQGVATSGNWISGIVTMALSLITQTIEAFTNAAAEEAEYQQNQLDYLNEYHNMLLKIKAEDYESIFGVEVFRRSADAIRNAREALSAYNKELS
ncbi:MAG: hypothetical protein EOM67_15210, partial [Spirochaetia bacterium]|nr:hypothetical protein [Spirochaetia bacterium]